MNDISTKTLLQILFLSVVFLSSCGSSHRTHGSSRNYSKDYTKNRSKKSTERSYSSSSTKKIRKAPSTKTARKSEKIKDGNRNRSSSSESNAERAARVSLVSYANTLQGIPYVYGGKKRSGLDCSGFVSHVYSNQGVSIAGNSNYQATLGRKIPVSAAREGDLVFFGNGKKISHVAIVVKQDRDQFVVIHSTSSKGVIEQDIKNSDYWQAKILFARDLVGTMPLAD